jgi:anaerobic dimethyl sulfoxide reductase subunit B (iron-sulfur subunit)
MPVTQYAFFVDSDACSGCKTCQVACKDRYDPGPGVSKCHFCPDELAAGKPPVCVAACPNRALDFGDLQEIRAKHGTASQVFPLMDPAIARPALVIKPHRHAALAQARDPEVANWEEI